MKKLFLLCLVLPISLSLSSCASQRAALGGIATVVIPTASKLIDTAVAIAVTAELLKDPATTHLKAVAFTTVANQFLAASANPTVTVAQLEDTLNKRLVALAPNPIIAASVIQLIGGLQGALNNVIGANTSGPLTQNTLIAINGIAKQVIAVSAFY
jgi:hypothetical protein